MSRYFALLVVLLLTQAAALGQGPGAPIQGQKKQDSQHQEAKPTNMPNSTIQEPAKEESGTSIKKPPAGESDHYQQADLDAQVRMAKAAEDLLDLTYWQNLLAFMNAIGLIATIALTTWAARSASKAVTTARETIATDRAWITCTGPRQSIAENTNIDGTNYKQTLMVQACWLNCGRSPGIEIEVVIASKLLAEGSEAPQFIPDWIGNREKAISGPNNGFFSPHIHIVGDRLTELLSGSVELFVQSAVRYKDVFNDGKHHLSIATFAMFKNGDLVDNRGRVVPRFEIRQAGIATAT